MNFRKVKYCPCVLFLMVLMLMGCGEKAKQPEEESAKTLETQSEYVEGAIAEIMIKMNWDVNAEIAKKIRTRRSLAVHILKNHTTLMAYFMSQQWEKLPTEKVDGIELYTFDSDGNRVPSTDAPNIFWQNRYADIKCVSDEDIEAIIELEANVKEVWLEDVDDLELDCRARVDYEFRVVCKDENGIVTSSLRGGIRSWLCHRNPCPWDVCPVI